MMCGFDGISSTNSCALPELILAAYRALEAGEAKAARDLHQLWYPLRALAREFGQPQTTKAAMNLRGFDGGSVRLPLRNLRARQHQRRCQGAARAGGRSAIQRCTRRLTIESVRGF
jgi:dihydrodipicolinate synthase/N-acetylneuraminate lyase